MKIVTVIGARPQFIKAAAVSNEIINFNKNTTKIIEEIIVHTGQHYDTNMSDVFFEEMNIPKPSYFLGIGGKSHGAMTGQMLEKIEEILEKEKPDFLMVYGDTNSTLAGALAASKMNIKLVHIEAGLRSFNMNMPEEVNRILTDRISSILFCPTKTAVDNLEEEGYKNIDCKIELSGDVMQDAAILFNKYSQKPKIDLPDNFILSTIHRAENTNDKERLGNILTSLAKISEEESIILPLHPRTKKLLEEYGLSIPNSIICIEPVGYLEMVYLLRNCSMVVTDSGGMQKEAFFFEKPCMTLRDETEWVELLENNANILVGANKEKIIEGYKAMKKANIDFSLNLYGGGNASKNIIKILWERIYG
ncbi:non-hydrolyzing UDP-N-acetylglucosamine 2-epimerase [Tenacibaculum ovolyticum]|uniref:non-hydrolyzing UDP-N-acetylglucosamine 2-epimerase n=1 Tax=Tenacibaculum ovolyticum TaxID=104270 RepID=UPI003BAC9AF5